jgi:hypothetical protein
MAEQPESERLSRYFSQMGKKGAKVRMRKLTPEQRQQIAREAGKASGVARKKKAKKKRGET